MGGTPLRKCSDIQAVCTPRIMVLVTWVCPVAAPGLWFRTGGIEIYLLLVPGRG